jgi:hypothetical protein
MGKRTEYHKQYFKQYKIDNKEKIKQYAKQYNIDNKKQKAEDNKQYYLDNKEKLKQYHINNPKVKIISQWKRLGIIDDDWDGLYDYFIKETNCWICDKVYNKHNKMDLRCLDHDHDITDDNNIRYICCGYCNINIIK